MAPVNTCRSCDALIIWARTPAGRLMPLDVAPNPEGNVTLEDGRVRVLGAVAAGQRRAMGVPLFMAHHVSCPQGRPRH